MARQRVDPGGGSGSPSPSMSSGWRRSSATDHILLLRLHYLLARSSAERPRRVRRNVSDHPDIRELYLAADVLITDYSSAMFDFAVTGKPIVLYTYDLERVPRQRPGLLLRPRGRGAGAAVPYDGRGDRRLGRRRRRKRPLRGSLRTVSATLLSVRRRPGRRSGRDRAFGPGPS